MKSVPFALVVSLAMVLAACSNEPAETPEVPLAEEPAPAIVTAQSRTIPMAFRGVWDAPGSGCDPASQMRLEVTDDRLVFYESVGTVTAVEQVATNTVTLQLDMTGEGESWSSSETLRLTDDGAQLTMERAAGEAVVRAPCPA